jgi:hypothetical protein
VRIKCVNFLKEHELVGRRAGGLLLAMALNSCVDTSAIEPTLHVDAQHQTRMPPPQVIDVSHGRQLHTLCAYPSVPLFAPGLTHQNLELSPDYVPSLRRFLQECFGEDYRRQGRGRG